MRRCCKYGMPGDASDWRSWIGDSVNCSPTPNSCSTPDCVISIFCTYFFFGNSSPPPPVSGTGQALTPPTPSASLRTGRGGEYASIPWLPPTVPLTEGVEGPPPPP